MKNPLVSIIIVNLNTRNLLRACLASVTADPSATEAEIIVIDNGSIDESVAMVRQEFPGVLLQVNAENQRFARPNNDGMKKARGRYLFFLNSDAEVTAGTVGSLVQFMESHPRAGACGPLLEYPDGRLQRSVSKFHSPWTHICDMLFLDALFPHSKVFVGGEMMKYPYDESKTQCVESIMGAAFMVRRTVVEQTGMFDEQLTVFYNEMDWFRRMKSDGWEVYYAPVARVIHHRGVTSESMNRGYQYLGEMYYNVFHYFRKYYGSWGLRTYRVWLFIGFTLRWMLWQGRAFIHRSERTNAQLTYTKKVLGIAFRFWVPAERYAPVLPADREK